MDTVPISIKRSLFEKLQALATPLVDDVDAVIEKLIAHWQGNQPNKATRSIEVPSRRVPTVWRTKRGDELPLGLTMTATYLNKKYTAKVTDKGIEFNGKFYDDPSNAGVAVKLGAGRKGTATSTNGWKFWWMPSPTKPNHLIQIGALRNR